MFYFAGLLFLVFFGMMDPASFLDLFDGISQSYRPSKEENQNGKILDRLGKLVDIFRSTFGLVEEIKRETGSHNSIRISQIFCMAPDSSECVGGSI